MQETYLAVKVRPNSGKEVLITTGPGRFEAWVKAKPVEGRANDAIVSLLARSLRLPAASIRLVKGAHKRNKLFKVVG